MKTTYEYNDLGQLISESVEGLGTMEYTYDKGQLVSITDYDGGITSFAYDDVGNQISATDSAGKVTKKQYDALGHLTENTDSMGNKTSYTYDYMGNLAHQQMHWETRLLMYIMH